MNALDLAIIAVIALSAVFASPAASYAKPCPSSPGSVRRQSRFTDLIAPTASPFGL